MLQQGRYRSNQKEKDFISIEGSVSGVFALVNGAPASVVSFLSACLFSISMDAFRTLLQTLRKYHFMPRKLPDEIYKGM